MNNPLKIYIVMGIIYARVSFECVLNLKLFQINPAKLVVCLCEIKILFYICIEHKM
jgi:hypothetical protein